MSRIGGRRGIGSVVGKSEDRTKSMRDQVLENAENAEKTNEADSEQFPVEDGPSLDLSFEDKESIPDKRKKRKRNHKIPVDYFRALDDILADSYIKQEAAFNLLESFTRMMEARGISGTFESERFEKAAGNLAIVAMIREMAWLFGLGHDLSERIAEHTADRLFSPGHVNSPKVNK